MSPCLREEDSSRPFISHSSSKVKRGERKNMKAACLNHWSFNCYSHDNSWGNVWKTSYTIFLNLHNSAQSAVSVIKMMHTNIADSGISHTENWHAYIQTKHTEQDRSLEENRSTQTHTSTQTARTHADTHTHTHTCSKMHCWHCMLYAYQCTTQWKHRHVLCEG